MRLEPTCCEEAVVTTLVTSEGRSLTEVKLTVKNQAQPFLKFGLPAGSTILSAEVAGEKVKPVEGPDGNRVPLLRPGFRPTGSYNVSFVFMHSGAPFAKKGGSELALPKMDVPIDVLHWEVFLPQQYQVKDFGGDAIAANLVPSESVGGAVVFFNTNGGTNGYRAEYGRNADALVKLAPGAANAPLGQGQIGGMIVDPQGAVVPRVNVKVTNLDTGSTTTTTTDDSGYWRIMGMRPGRVKIEATAQGFKAATRTATYDPYHPSSYDFRLRVGEASETVEVTSEAPIIDVVNNGFNNEDRKKARRELAQQETAPSANVVELQKRIAGVLPVRVDVPRAGSSYKFVPAGARRRNQGDLQLQDERKDEQITRVAQPPPAVDFRPGEWASEKLG